MFLFNQNDPYDLRNNLAMSQTHQSNPCLSLTQTSTQATSMWLYQLQIIQTIFNLILGYHMQQPQEQPSHSESISPETPVPNQDFDPSSIAALNHINPHLVFQKNYPKNIFIPLIEHLNELGLRKDYQACVGTRESFEGKNVVSLAEIYRVMSQSWFAQSINLPALISNMSNKILMNSKIKKKLFHLLLVRELFAIPLEDPRQFKKIVSRRASEVAQSKLPTDSLFDYPSALIYLLSLFANGLSGTQKPQPQRQEEEEAKKYLNLEENSLEMEGKKGIKEVSSKEEYKHHISKIVAFINAYQGQPAQLLRLIQAVKIRIEKRQQEVRSKYGLAPKVPEWSYFNTIVINNCYLHKRNKTKLTFSMLNQWIQQFKEKATSLHGFLDLHESQPQTYHFAPIVLIPPPL